MQQVKKKWLWTEFALLFAVLPIVIALPISPWLKFAMAFVAILYIVAVLRSNNQFKKSALIGLGNSPQWRRLLVKFAVFALISTGLVAYFFPQQLFIIPLEYTLMWLAISGFYVIFSVYPQELIYRYFYFWRYHTLVEKQSLFITLNALVFCLAHLLFWNSLVLALTLAGGFLFAYTFSRSNSLMFTSIEHSLYGLWLYTLGIGEMLAFPMPTS